MAERSSDISFCPEEQRYAQCEVFFDVILWRKERYEE